MTPVEGILGLLTAAVAGNPASVFLEKVSALIEGGVRPWQIRRVAAAEADAAVFKAEGDEKIAGLQARAALRVATEEVRHQLNIEAPIRKALPNIGEDAKPGEMDDDWLTNFFDKCRLISNEEMQDLWAHILAGEANKPGSYSPRTINFLATLTQGEAKSFRRLCSYNWVDSEKNLYPIVFYADNEMPVPLNRTELIHLQSIGLITYHYGSFRSGGITLWTEKIRLFYHEKAIDVEFIRKDNDAFSKPNIYLGSVTLTQMGKELASICEPAIDYNVVQYTTERLIKDGRSVNLISQP